MKQKLLLSTLFAFAVCSLCAFCSCSMGSKKTAPSNQTSAVDTTLKNLYSAPSALKFDSMEIDRFLTYYPDFKQYENDFKTFYRGRNYSYAWFDQEGMIEQAQALWHHLDQISSKELTIKLPYLDSLQNFLQPEDHSDLAESVKPNPTSDLMLTGQYLNYINYVLVGKVASETEKIGWFIPSKKLSSEEMLNQIVEKGLGIDSIEKKNMLGQYSLMRAELSRLREKIKYDTLGVIAEIPKPGMLKPGTKAVQIPMVKAKLMFWGFLNDTTGGALYTPSMQQAVKRYKASVGLRADTLISNEMVAELNVPLQKRIQTILANMERLRWLPKDAFTDEFILVNIPEYTLHFYENKKETWSCNVVVGKEMTKTVIFTGNMSYVVFSPYWNVPPSIYKGEVLPGIKKDPNYLAKHHMERYENGVRQLPGTANSLGLVKFIFPNSNNIYLHDTPSKSLFSRDQRAFSHGCVRVGKPRDLAIKVLSNDPEWTPEKIDEAMHAGVEKTVSLKKKIPVYIAYFTAFVDKDGQLNFRKDVYKRDDKLLNIITN